MTPHRNHHRSSIEAFTQCRGIVIEDKSGLELVAKRNQARTSTSTVSNLCRPRSLTDLPTQQGQLLKDRRENIVDRERLTRLHTWRSAHHG